MARSALDKAARLAARGRHAEIVSLLEPQLPIYRESPRFYYLLGSACLRSGDSGGAYTYLKRAEQLDRTDADTKLALAALHLRRAETERAVALYLEALELRPRDPVAARALAFMRREGSTELIPALVDSGRIARFYPPARGLPPYALPAAAGLLVLVAAFALYPAARTLARRAAEARAPRPEVAAVALSAEDRADPVGSGGSFSYVLTEKEALASFEKAKALFQEYRDNAALVELNRLSGSNAAASIKEKARALRAYVQPPDFRSVRDVPSFAEVSRDPRLYDGCAVAWKGRAANLAKEGGVQRFDFLVGYEAKKRLEGIVPARSADPETAVPAEKAFELLGLVRAAGAGGTAGAAGAAGAGAASARPSTSPAFYIECLALHELLEE